MRTVGDTIRRAGTALALSVSAFACSNPIAPSDTAGVYGWRGAVNVMLPSDEIVRVVADTFVLRRDMSGVRRTYAERLAVGTQTPVVEIQETVFSYRVAGRAICFSWECPVGVVCAAMLRYDWFDLRGDGFVSRDDPPAEYVRRGDAPTL